MTEKRFYYNTFYHKDDMSRVLEYEIIDRQSYPNYPEHDEKEDVPDWYIYIGENDSDWQDMLINLLNQLNDENEELKQFKSKVLELLDEKIRHYEHKPFSAPVGQPMSVNFDADMDRIARLSELQHLKKELEE